MKKQNGSVIIGSIGPLLVVWIELLSFLLLLLCTCTSTTTFCSVVNGFTSLDTSTRQVQSSHSNHNNNNNNYGNTCMWSCNNNKNTFVPYNNLLLSCRSRVVVCNDRKPKKMLQMFSRLSSFRLQTTTKSINTNDVHDNIINPNQYNYQIQIEYCPGCRWGLRAFWMAQELLMFYGTNNNESSTSNNAIVLQSVTLIPTREPIEGGRYRIHYMSSASSTNNNNNNNNNNCNSKRLWDRKEQGRFPTVEELIQLINNENNNEIKINDEKTAGVLPTTLTTTLTKSIPKLMPNMDNDSSNVVLSPNIGILYNNNYLLRANYYGMELLSTFSEEINSITFIPIITPPSTATFIVTLDEGRIILWDKSTSTTTSVELQQEDQDQQHIIFPETKVLKQLVRDNIIPTKDLGHSDVIVKSNSTTATLVEDELDNEQAEEARRFFGVI